MTKVSVSRIATLKGHNDAVYTLENSLSADKFYSSGGDGMIAEWSLNGSEDGQLLAKVPSSVYAIKLIEEHKLLVVGQNFDGVQLVNVESKEVVASRAFTDQAIFDIEYYGSRIYVGTGDGKVFALTVPELEIVGEIKLSEEKIRSIHKSKDAKTLVVGGSDNCVRILDLVTLKPFEEWKAHDNSVFSVSENTETGELVSVGRDAHIRTWDMTNYVDKKSIPAHMYAINDLVYSPNRRYFATCSMDKSIKVWDATSYQLLKVIDKARHAGHGTSVNKLLWTSYNDYLISCSDDRTISIWNLEFNEE